MRRSAWSALMALVLLLVAGCGGVGGSGAAGTAFAADGRLKVVASIYPVYEFARAVGGDRIDLVQLVPPGAEPHNWEPSVRDIRTLNAADVFFYNGAGLEHWVGQVLASLDNRELQVVETSEGFALLDVAGHEHGEDGEATEGAYPEHEADGDAVDVLGQPDEESGHRAAGGEEARDAAATAGSDTHDHGDLDPHVWLDPAGAAHAVARIRDALAAADPEGADYYRARAAEYLAELDSLDQDFRAGLSQCRRRVFFTTHAAFGYLAHRYGLEQRAVMGLSPDAEPTPGALRAVVEEAREQDVRYIFFETLASDKVARVVAQEVGAQTLVLNPFEGLTPEQVAAGENYFSIMHQNLTNLRTALECD